MSWSAARNACLAGCIETFDAAEPGQPVLYLPGAGGSHTIHGVFSEQHVELDPETGTTITSQSPLLTLRLAELPVTPLVDVDRVQVRGVTYRVKDIQEGTGGRASLVLHRE
ncbi:MAG: electron transfer flavoprotein [Planctomycetota bacterium]|nr:MAG: electron transfer flavoprotein [Planctomycetota bacterium]